MLVKLLKVINDYHLNNEELTILAPTMSLENDLGLDSIDKFSLILSLEIELRSDIKYNANIETVRDVIKIMEDLDLENKPDPLIGSPFHN